MTHFLFDKRILFLTAICNLMLSAGVMAQEATGLVNGTYSGIAGSMINPANTAASPFYFDLNWLSADIFAENNCVYLAKEEYRFSRFLQPNAEFPKHGPNNNLIAYDYYNAGLKQAYFQTRVLGPSAMVSFGRHTVGLITGARVAAFADKVPFDVAKFAFENLLYPPQYDINYVDNKNMYAAGLAWGEIGGHYSYIVRQNGLDFLSAGITLKYLMGFGGGYLRIEDVDYVMLDQDTLLIKNINAQAGLSLPVDFGSNSVNSSGAILGKGLGMDLGVVYELKKKSVVPVNSRKLCAQPYAPYYFRIGASLLDIGRIRFKKNAIEVAVADGNTYWPNLRNTQYSNVNALINSLDSRFVQSADSLTTAYTTSIWLPMAGSVQADVNLADHWFVNGTAVFPLFITKNEVARPTTLSVTPRYQRRWFEAALPVSFYNWYKMRIGASLRIRNFTIGTDKLGGFLHLHDFTGLDIYFGLRFNLLKGNCKSFNSGTCGYNEYKKFLRK